MKYCFAIVFSFFAFVSQAQKPHSQLLAETAMKMWPDSFSVRPGGPARWSYDQGVILKGIEGVWNSTGDGKWFKYIQHSMDYYVNEDGTIKGYRPDEYNIDHINNGKILLTLYRVTGKEKYKKAVDLLRGQLRTHPRTKEGGFWHKKIYPWQMWLDGLYMGEPFYAEYAMLFHEDTAFNDIAKQFILMERHARDAKTGLLYHGWDESREQKWADKKTGLSPHFWARALGWYGMAMVDVLDYFPENHPGRDSIIAILNRFAKAVTKVQDTKTGLWYDIVDLPNKPKNYTEASASCMLVYALAKGMRKGYLPVTYIKNVNKAYHGILTEFIKADQGQTNLHGTVSVSGLGGNPYRDGSFEYYMSEPVVVNDPKGMGAFINAAVEMEALPSLAAGRGKTVLLDNYFNNEWKKDITGTDIRWHYTWDDRSNGGFAMLGDIFRFQGAKTKSLADAPTVQNLKQASVYIIVDPDTQKETPKPNYVEDQHVKAIREWVKAGGVLLLMANDSANCDLPHFNKLASSFGVTFTNKSRNMVKNDQFETGLVSVRPKHVIFGSRDMFLKEISVLDVKPGAAITTVSKEGDAIMAYANYGKGTVFFVGDPWIYNEYIDGRKLPPSFQNYDAAWDLAYWLIKRSKK